MHRAVAAAADARRAAQRVREQAAWTRRRTRRERRRSAGLRAEASLFHPPTLDEVGTLLPLEELEQLLAEELRPRLTLVRQRS
jgi:hypothetical protein